MMAPPRLKMLAVLGALAVAAGARAGGGAAPAIRDEAGLLTPDGVQKAEEEARNIHKIYQIPIVVETAEAPPDDVKKQLQAAKDNAEKTQILQDWAGRRAADAGAGQAVYVLICKDVARGWFGLRKYGSVVVTVPPEMPERSFTAADAKALHDRLARFTMGQDREKNDRLLLTALTQLRDEKARPPQPAFPWAAVGGVFAGAVVAWLALVVVRMRLAASEPPEPRRPGLFHALLGGMFGSAAGHWIYDTLFVAASAQSAPAAEAPPPAPEPPAPAEAPPKPAGPATQAERLDLAAHDHMPDGEPTAPGPDADSEAPAEAAHERE
jgi:hypothetical protein